MKEAIVACACCKKRVVDGTTVPVKVSSSDVDVKTVYVCLTCSNKYSGNDFEEMLGSV